MMVPLDLLSTVAATAVVTAMAKDGWDQAKRTILGIWRGHHPVPGQDQVVAAQLEHARNQLLAAQADQLPQVEGELTDHWRKIFESELDQDQHAQTWLQELVESLQYHSTGHLVRASLNHSGSGDNVAADTVNIYKGVPPRTTGDAK